MSALRSTIKELLATDPVDLSDAEFEAEAADLTESISLLNTRLVMVVNEAEVRKFYLPTGFLNATSWLASLGDMEAGVARYLVGLGRFFRRNPATSRQAADGKLSASRIRHLRRAARRHPEFYGDHEEMLLGFAAELSLAEFRKAIDHWIAVGDDLKGKPDPDGENQATLHASPTLGGLVKVDGMLDKLGGETMLTALDAAMASEVRSTPAEELRPASQRRADALVTICRYFLDNQPGQVGGNRPHVNVIIDLDTFEGRTGKRFELAHTGVISPETARRILCDAQVSWVLTKGDSVPLAMGRAVRFATADQMRALAVRDGGCTWPGCHRPPSWCEAHHIVPWHEGGTTDLDNLRLLCRRHHMMTHQDDARVRRYAEYRQRSAPPDLRPEDVATVGLDDSRPRGP